MNAPTALWISLLMLTLGWSFKQLRALPDNAAETLNKLVLNLCLPALILVAVSKLQLNLKLLLVPLVAWAVMLLSALLVKLLAHGLRFSREVEGCLLLTAVLGNTAFLGYPLTQAYLGEASLGPAVLYDQLGSFLVFSSVGLWISARYGGGKSPGISETVQKILSFPAFLALMTGLALNFFELQIPPLAMNLLIEIKQLLVPLAMFAVGLNFSLIPPKGQTTALMIGLSIKLLFAPLIAILIAWPLLDRPERLIAGFQAAMPPMVTAAVLAASARLAPNLAAAMAGFGILASLLWLPILLVLLKQLV